MPDSKRVRVGSPEDHVIQKLDVDGLRGVAELSGHVHVRSARSRVAGRMIVHARYRRGGLADGGSEYLARVREGGGLPCRK